MKRSLLLASIWVAVASAANAAGDPLAEVVARAGHTRWTPGNQIRLLVYPEEAWQARLDLLNRAQHHIFVSTFSWHDDVYGREFARRLAEVVAERRRSNPEFEALCMIDATAMGVFNRFSRTFRQLRDAGAVLRPYNTATATTTPWYDGRMHDKMLIVDGRWAIVSGRNIAEEYFDPQSWWMDLGVLVDGEAVADLQMHFMKAWAAAADLGKAARAVWPEEQIRRRIRSLWLTGRFPGGASPLERFMTPEFFPAAGEPPGAQNVAVLYDNSLVWPRAASTDVVIELARRAVRELDIMSPFPNFEEELTAALEGAVWRGVRVRLFVNGQEAVIRRGPFWLAGVPSVIRLIEAGAEVWAWSGDRDLRAQLDDMSCAPPRLPPYALHGKLVRVDDRLSIVHSSNFNIRSTFYNTEAGVAVLDPDFNREVEMLLDDLVSLHDLRLRCGNGVDQVTVADVVRRLTADDLPRLRRALGSKQHLLDSMSVLW